MKRRDVFELVQEWLRRVEEVVHWYHHRVYGSLSVGRGRWLNLGYLQTLSPCLPLHLLEQHSSSDVHVAPKGWH